MPGMKYFRRKICLLGDAAVGKTSLIRRYVEDKFDDKYVVTLGTKVTMREQVIQDPNSNQPMNMTLMIWDILGQREYKRLQTSFYRGANGALVVVDITRKETLDSLHGWILSLFNSVGKVPILILLNKNDLTEQTAIKSEDMDDAIKKYETSYLLTSAKTGENVDLAFKKMSEMLLFREQSKGSQEGNSKSDEMKQFAGPETKIPSETGATSDKNDNDSA
ncbi:MAG: GTP-binding protein [Thermoplasmata archaeon]|nr:MAG: GTP-binding protein [Thermoplasmata archaeon]